MIWTVAFWKGAGERAIKTFAQTLAAYFVIGTTGLLAVDWLTALSVSAAAAVASVLTSVGNAGFVAGGPDTVVVVEAKHRDEDGDGVADVYTGDSKRDATYHDPNGGGGYLPGQAK